MKYLSLTFNQTKHFMKKLCSKLFIAVLLVAAATQAKAALFINNNTNCDLKMELYAHDLNHGICGLQSNWFLMGANSSVAYNNVATINTTSPFWVNGPAVLTGGTSVWGWDATKFYFTVTSFSGVVGASGSCIPSGTTTIPGACAGTNVTVTWTTLGSNTIIDIDY
jgi:hypothetical protein